MSQRNSEYARIPGDVYVTPRWVYEVLYTVEPWAKEASDPAPPPPHKYDFLGDDGAFLLGNIVTNPPFQLSEKFVRKSINLINPLNQRIKVAMLLPHAWDTAKSRRDLFEQKPFKAKYTLTTRIRWENLEQKKNGPSMNHAWYVWDWNHNGKPFMGWL